MSGSQNPLHSRRGDIIRALEQLAAQHEAWYDDPTTRGIEDGSEFDDAINMAIATICVGDVPADCREISDRMRRVELEYQLYIDRAKVTTTGEPVQAFWSAFRDVLEAFRKVRIAIEGRVLESVESLKAQGLNDHQIAVQYGIRKDGLWTGIFFNENGTPRADLIEKEAKNAGSVIPADFVHPEDIIRRGKLAIEMDGHLQRAETVAAESKTGIAEKSDAERLKEIEPDVVAYLKEGAMPWQAAKEFAITQQQVDDIAKRHGLAHETVDTSSDEDYDDAVEPVAEQQEVKPTPTTEAVKAKAIEFFKADDADNRTVATSLSKHFDSPITVQRVTALRAAWERAQQNENTAA